jgi:hypothetical protein
MGSQIQGFFKANSNEAYAWGKTKKILILDKIFDLLTNPNQGVVLAAEVKQITMEELVLDTVPEHSPSPSAEGCASGWLLV